MDLRSLPEIWFWSRHSTGLIYFTQCKGLPETHSKQLIFEWGSLMGILIMHSYTISKFCSWDKPELWFVIFALKETWKWGGKERSILAKSVRKPLNRVVENITSDHIISASWGKGVTELKSRILTSDFIMQPNNRNIEVNIVNIFTRFPVEDVPSRYLIPPTINGALNLLPGKTACIDEPGHFLLY